MHSDRKTILQCNLCEKEYSQPGGLKTHIEIKHKGIRYPCDVCSKVLTCASSLNIHMKSKHLGGKPCYCPHCSSSFASKSNLKIHIESKHENIKYPCEKCDAKLATVNVLKAHMENMHSDMKTVLQCNLCEKDYWTKGGLNLHISSKHSVKC